MVKAGRVALVFIDMLLSRAGLADDATPSTPDPLPPKAPSIDKLLAESGYAARWQLKRTVEDVPYTEKWQRPIADIEFQDPNAFTRVTRLRTLSLLTLASSGRSRLFFGVNEEGLLGFHFRAVSRGNDERYLELGRMPYLKEAETETPPGKQ